MRPSSFYRKKIICFNVCTENTFVGAKTNDSERERAAFKLCCNQDRVFAICTLAVQ